MSALSTQCPGNTVQTGTGNVDPARKFKCTTTARETPIASQLLIRECQENNHLTKILRKHLFFQIVKINQRIF